MIHGLLNNKMDNQTDWNISNNVQANDKLLNNYYYRIEESKNKARNIRNNIYLFNKIYTLLFLKDNEQVVIISVQNNSIFILSYNNNYLLK